PEPLVFDSTPHDLCQSTFSAGFGGSGLVDAMGSPGLVSSFLAVAVLSPGLEASTLRDTNDESCAVSLTARSGPAKRSLTRWTRPGLGGVDSERCAAIGVDSALAAATLSVGFDSSTFLVATTVSCGVSLPR